MKNSNSTKHSKRQRAVITQCSGCMSGMPLDSSSFSGVPIHYENGRPVMTCQKHKYLTKKEADQLASFDLYD